MFVNKQVSRVYQSGIFIILGIVFCVSLVNASSPLKDKDEFTQQYANDEEDDLTESGVEVGNPDTADIEGEEIKEIVLNIKGMTCGKCEETLKAGLLTCDGIEEAKVSYKESRAVIKVNVFKIDYDNILDVVNGAGFSLVGEE